MDSRFRGNDIIFPLAVISGRWIMPAFAIIPAAAVVPDDGRHSRFRGNPCHQYPTGCEILRIAIESRIPMHWTRIEP